jgi:hypothetical protein
MSSKLIDQFQADSQLVAAGAKLENRLAPHSTHLTGHRPARAITPVDHAADTRSGAVLPAKYRQHACQGSNRSGGVRQRPAGRRTHQKPGAQAGARAGESDTVQGPGS